MYLVAILHWFSRFVIARELDQVLESPCALKAVDRALQQAQPAILNGDQGSHFTGLPYPERLLAVGVRISTDGRCRVMDSVFAERLWRSVYTRRSS
jgi:putative transposase